MVAPTISVRATAPQVVYVLARETGANTSRLISATGTPSAPAPAQATSSGADTGDTGGITIGGKVGIAISVTIGTITAACAALFMFKHRERQRKREAAMDSTLRLAESGRSAARMEARAPFLPPVARVDTMSDISIGGLTAKSELDGVTSAVTKFDEIKEEEEIEQVQHVQQHGEISELPGDTPAWP